jgi:hypothetical protein
MTTKEATKAKKETAKIETTEEKKSVEKKPPEKKPSKTAKAVEYMIEVIQSKEVTRKALAEMTQEEFPELAKSTITTILSDGKNPKYNRYFPTLLTTDENQILKFL